MYRPAALAATTAIILSFMAPAYAKGSHDNDKHHAEKAEAHAAKKSEHAARKQEKDELRETERLNKDSARAALRARTASQRLEFDQARQTEKLQKQEATFQRRLTKQQLSAQQREQRLKFAQELSLQKREDKQRLQALKRQNRLAHYRLEQDYLSRLEQQRVSLINARDFLPYDTSYYNVPVYRYARGGQYYETSRYGGSLLEQAVNYGCKEGYAAGVADRQDGWRYNATSSYIYQDANYGYSGILVPRSDYNYYFRQGYQRCYQNGYNGKGSTSSILESVLENVLGLQLLR